MGPLTPATTALRTAIMAAIMAWAATAKAQTDPQYRMEIGAGVGLMAYQGDFNGSIAKGMKPAATALAKYRFNPRMALALGVGYGNIEGASDGSQTWYPEYADSVGSFSSTIIDASLKFEYNFWPFGTGREYYGAKHLTPYVTMGVGMTVANVDERGTVVTAAVPIGLGVKYKLGARVNVALEWAMHFTLSDKLDGVDDPYGIESSGAFKNADSYSTLTLSITYDIWAKCRTCHNDSY